MRRKKYKAVSGPVLNAIGLSAHDVDYSFTNLTLCNQTFSPFVTQRAYNFSRPAFSRHHELKIMPLMLKTMKT
jgi:hypothetical protein